KVNEMEVKEGKKKAGSIYAHISNDFFKTINAGTYFDVCISLDDGGYNSSALVFAIEENKQVAYITHKENIISMRVLYLTKEGILSTTSYNRGLSHDVANIWVDFFLKLSANCKKDIFFGSRESSSFIENIESKIKNISENQTKDHFIDKVIFDEYYDDYGQSGLYIKDSSLIKSYTHACVLEYAKRDEKRNELYNEVLNKEKKDTHDILKNKPIEDIQKHSFIGNILSGLRHKDKTVRDNALKSVLEGDDEEQKRKTINSLVSNALYSENETRQQNAKEQLKQVNDKELIISVLEEHKVRLEKKRLTEEHKENFNELAEELGIEGYGKDSKDTFIFNNIRIEKEFSATDLEKCASLVRDLGIEENDKILEIGPNEFVSFGLLCAINGANVDFVQPGRNINKTKESINYFFEFNKSEAVLESKKRINIINNYLEDAKELQINYDKYTVITLFNILDIIRNVELIVSEVTKYIKKDGYILISEYSGMQQDFSSKLYLLRSKIEEKGFVLDYIGEKTDGRNDLMVYKVSDKVEKKRATYIIKRKNKIKEDRATLIFQIRDEKGYFLSKKAIKFEFNGEKEYQKTSENQ
ncbi:MAG: hypothetical protein KAQ92_06575, partial [Candidatus Aenigmarchaeota archaeon]|nr:hypothetical protein [Candidatus Aenigmarchaeota archaeon]